MRTLSWLITTLLLIQSPQESHRIAWLSEILYDLLILQTDFARWGRIVTLEKERVIHSTSVSRTQLRAIKVKDKVVPNNSQVKFPKKEEWNWWIAKEMSIRLTWKQKSRLGPKDMDAKIRKVMINKFTNSSYSLLDLDAKAHDGTSQALLCNFCGEISGISTVFCERSSGKRFYLLVVVGSDLYTIIFFKETNFINPICFMATLHQSAWFYGIEDFLILTSITFTLLSTKDVVDKALPKLTYVKDKLCSSCEMCKAKEASSRQSSSS
ncbi:hypothetical protein Tco_0751829 [Tanacetum coccineum]|uniref:Uncharacterized protein n=1 Tax=Tanacetum coccineum TaxID=301880 RepID=A0ABQ4Z556_9ASTR